MNKPVCGGDLSIFAQGYVVAQCLKFGFYVKLAVVIQAKNKLSSKIMKDILPSPYTDTQCAENVSV